MRRIPYLLVVIVTIGSLLASCNLPFLVDDTASVQTAAALTVQAQLSPVAGASPTSTFTPVPFPTLPPANTQPPVNTLPPAASATSNCDNASFITDVTIPDNTEIDAGDGFTKTWRLKNIGGCSWTPSYSLVFISGASMSGPAVQAMVGNVNPGQTVDVSVNLTAPAADGTYTGNWGLRNGAGVIFSHFYVQIVVDSGAGGAFAVTHVTFDLSTFDEGTYNDCPIVTAHITTNGAGDVDYHWTRSDGASSGVESLHFNAAGTKNVQEKWYLGSAAAGSHWIGIYIDDPNHQDFGHKNINPCVAP